MEKVKMQTSEMSIEAKKVLRILDAEFLTDFTPNSLTQLGVYEKVAPFWDFFIKENFIECIDEEIHVYKVTNRGRYILSMVDAEVVDDLTIRQKNALIIMSLTNGNVSVTNNFFDLINYCNHKSLIDKGFIKIIGQSGVGFELTKKSERFVKNHCIIT